MPTIWMKKKVFLSTLAQGSLHQEGEIKSLDSLVLETNDGLEFFRQAFAFTKTSNHSFSYSVLARMAGIPSASYVREVLQGKRSLTSKGFSALCKGFKLSPDLIKLLKLMLARELDHFNSERLSASALEAEITHLKRLLVKKDQVVLINHMPVTDYLSALTISKVISAMGENSQGVTSEEIQAKTNFDEELVGKCLRYLLSKKILERSQDGRFLLPENKVLFEADLEESFVKNLYVEAMQNHLELSSKNFMNKENINLVFTFSADKDKIIQIREQIKKVIFDLVDDHENPTGNKVHTLVFGLSS